MRVTQFLSDERVTFEEMVHPPAFTSQKLARFLHLSGHQVVKSILLKGPGGFFLAVLPAARTIDLHRLHGHCGAPVRLATLDELYDQFRDCEWGALQPFGGLYGMPTLLEAAIPLHTKIVFEAQQHALAIRMTCSDFVRLEKPARVAFAREVPAPRPQPQPRAG